MKYDDLILIEYVNNYYKTKIESYMIDHIHQNYNKNHIEVSIKHEYKLKDKIPFNGCMFGFNHISMWLRRKKLNKLLQN